MHPNDNHIPQPLQQPPDLFALMRLCGIPKFNGTLGALLWCPRCKGRPTKITDKDKPRGHIESLRIYLNTYNEVLMRWHRCGLAGTALNLYYSQSGRSWSGITESLKQACVFGNDSIPSSWILRAKRWEKFAAFFETAKGIFRHELRRGKIDKLVFGEVGMASAIQLERCLPGIRLVSGWGKTNMFLIELRRSIYGHPIRIVLRHAKLGQTVAYFDFEPSEPIQLMFPEWALYSDWSEEIVTFSDLRLAGELHEIVSNPPQGECPALAWIADCHRPILDDLPCRTVRYLPSPTEGPELALAFNQPGVEALIRSENALETVASDVIARNPEPASAIAYLQAVLQKPWIAPVAAQRLTEAVAARLGKDAFALIARSGASDRVLPFTLKGTTYLCRNGIYVKRKGKGEWQPATNFSLRIEESYGDEDEKIFHRMLLFMENNSTTITISNEELQNGVLLRKKIVSRAFEGGFKEVPRVCDPNDLKRLPSIVQATQLAQPIKRENAVALGFVDGRFHGPNFTVTSAGVAIYPTKTKPKKQQSWILSEKCWEPVDYHLNGRANEFATWLDELDEKTKRMVGVVIQSALMWLHRGGRGLSSYLLLSSDAHLDLLSHLTGIVPIDVGRGPREHSGLPRLMHSTYWKPEQFKRQGRVVAALEDQHHKISDQITVVLHNTSQTENIAPPAGILSLFVHACIGTKTVENAAEKLVRLVECPKLRTRFHSSLKASSCYVASSEDYLDAFLSALTVLPDINQYCLNKKGQILLKRAVVKKLNHDHDFHFRETRLIEELRKRYLLDQPARYGREQVPVFKLPREALAMV